MTSIIDYFNSKPKSIGSSIVQHQFLNNILKTSDNLGVENYPVIMSSVDIDNNIDTKTFAGQFDKSGSSDKVPALLMHAADIFWGDVSFGNNETEWSSKAKTELAKITNLYHSGRIRTSRDIIAVLEYLLAHVSPEITYTITFNKNSNSAAAPASQTGVSGTIISLPTYTGTKTYTVSFNINGGTSTTPQSINYTWDATNWNTNSSGTGVDYSFGASYSITDNVTLYAICNTAPSTSPLVLPANPQKQFTAKFYNGSTLVLTRTYTYEFKGWYDAKTNGKEYTDASFNNLQPKSNTTIYAQWNSGTWDNNDLPDDQIKDGYDFNGWYSAQTGGTRLTSLSDTPTENLVYYAQFIEKQVNYYWYVGATEPTSLPTSDSELATGENSGWRKIGTNKPTSGTVIFDGTGSISVSSTKVIQYIAINKDVNLGFFDSLGNEDTLFATGPTVSNDINIYTTGSKSKSFDSVIKVI